MTEFQRRRSCRVLLWVPIRVFGIDSKGADFTEEALTVIVNLHGAEIRTTHQLRPNSEIRLYNHSTGGSSLFRVVSKLDNSELKFTCWGVENLNPGNEIWGVDIPKLQPGDQLKIRVTVECPTCSARESLPIDEAMLTSLQEKGGMERNCNLCNAPRLWTLLHFAAVK